MLRFRMSVCGAIFAILGCYGGDWEDESDYELDELAVDELAVDDSACVAVADWYADALPGGVSVDDACTVAPMWQVVDDPTGCGAYGYTGRSRWRKKGCNCTDVYRGLYDQRRVQKEWEYCFIDPCYGYQTNCSWVVRDVNESYCQRDYVCGW